MEISGIKYACTPFKLQKNINRVEWNKNSTKYREEEGKIVTQIIGY
jgi:hypothetical protein